MCLSKEFINTRVPSDAMELIISINVHSLFPLYDFRALNTPNFQERVIWELRYGRENYFGLTLNANQPKGLSEELGVML